MNSEQIETKIGDIEHAIDLLGGVINDLKDYDNYKSDIVTLDLMISALSVDIDELNEDLDNVLENEEKEWKAERYEREQEYWNSRL